MTEVTERAKAWKSHDPNDTTARFVQDLLNDGASSTNEKLAKLFPDGRLQFGTAGLRSRMQPGPVGMNDLVVVQTAQGLARYVIQEHKSNNDDETSSPPICAVIGYDHRSSTGESFDISSLSFAIFTALVFMEAGIKCFLMDGLVATPLVPFGVSRYVPEIMYKEQNVVSFGVMITASHNPAQDAGYKVYWTDGCQIRSPIDQGIAKSIEENLTPWTDYKKLYNDKKTAFPEDPCLGLSLPSETAKLVDAYYDAILRSGLVSGLGKSDPTSMKAVPRFCYTAMHGVGHRFAKQSFANFGLSAFVSVPEQEKPDPTFPTVVFPNPEEKGALDLAKQCARQQEPPCNIILANDPDADRLAVSEYNPETDSWNDLTGDQIGVLLGHWLWNQFSSLNDPRTISMCSSTVSSQMLRIMAKKEGFHYEDTLTGFKWIGSRAAQLSKSGTYRQVFCYEEAIGYCCGDVIFDKDGVTAAAVFAELSMHVYGKQGQTLVGHIQSLYHKYGEFVSNNGYYILEESSSSTVVPQIMDHITEGGSFARSHVGEYEITAIRYLGLPGYDSSTHDKKPTLPMSASSPMVTIRFSNGGVAQFRASGTEPKFKYYLELQGAPGVDRAKVEKDCHKWSELLLKELLKPEEFGLKSPSM